MLQEKAEIFKTASKMTVVMVMKVVELSKIIKTIRKISQIQNEH